MRETVAMNEQEQFEIKVMRLIDGELSPGEEDRLLAECELEPERFRAVALAFWEDRRLHAALRGGAGGHDWDVAASVVVNREGGTPDAFASEEAYPVVGSKQLEAFDGFAAPNSHAETRLRHEPQGKSWSGWLVGLAASLLVGAFVGYLGAQGDRESGGMAGPLALPKSHNAVTRDSEALAGGTADDAVLRTISDHPQEWEALARQLEPEPVFPPEALAELADDGVMVDQETELFLIELPGDRHLAVPAQWIDLSRRP